MLSGLPFFKLLLQHCSLVFYHLNTEEEEEEINFDEEDDKDCLPSETSHTSFSHNPIVSAYAL